MRSDTMMQAAEALREFVLGFPGVREEFPWGERVAKVGKRIFVFLGRSDEEKVAASPAKAKHMGEPGELCISVKLPWSGSEVLRQPFAQPTDYGLGKKGWVTLRFSRGERPPLTALRLWIEESYRAVAPKSLIAQLDGAPDERRAAGQAKRRARR